MALVPSRAGAYVLVSQGTKTASAGTAAVIVREADHNVTTFRFRIKDKGDRVAILVPLPASAAHDTLTLDRLAFAPLAAVVAARMEELWEQDPCELHGLVDPPAMPSAQPDVPPAGKPTKAVAVNAAGPSYEITVLDGKGADIVAALKKKGLSISAELEPVLIAYGDAGSKLLVAEIATADLEGSELPPLLVHTKASELSVPTRLLAAAKSGPLDLYVLSPGMRFEAKNSANLAIPTNLDVKGAALQNPAGFYAALQARAHKDQPEAVLTEYAWRATDCESCAAPLDAGSIAGLGVGFLPSAAGGQQEVIVDASKVGNEPDGPEAMRTELSACYGKAIAAKPGLGGSVTLAIEVKDDAVTSAKVTRAADPALVACATSAAKAADLDQSGALAITFSPTSRKFLSELVLTKLRVSNASIPANDLALGGARAIEGGREIGPEGKPEKKVSWAEAGNNFQPRYVVRHAFAGAVKCSSPQRGVWGPPPKGAASKPTKSASTLPALESVIEGGFPKLDAFVIASSQPPPSSSGPGSPAASSSSEPAAPPSPSAAPPAPPPPDAGCACSTMRASSGDRTPLSLLLAGLLAAVRRRRSGRRLGQRG